MIDHRSMSATTHSPLTGSATNSGEASWPGSSSVMTCSCTRHGWEKTGYIPPQDLGLVDAGPAQVRPITTTQVKSLIETRYRCWKSVGTGENRRAVAALFPQQSAISACEMARLGEDAPHLKALHGVSHTPTIRPDGTILDRTWLRPRDRVAVPTGSRTGDSTRFPNRPTQEQIRQAVGLSLAHRGIPLRHRRRPSHLDRPGVHPDTAATAPRPYQLGCDHRHQPRQRQDHARQHDHDPARRSSP